MHELDSWMRVLREALPPTGGPAASAPGQAAKVKKVSKRFAEKQQKGK